MAKKKTPQTNPIILENIYNITILIIILYIYMNISPTDGGLPPICWSNLKATMRDVEPFLDMFGEFES
jgi:hypothetical protein